MKKSILSITLILILTTILISCWCPVGNPNDYEDIKDNSDDAQYAYPLYSGKAYHADAMFSYSENGSRNTYKFIAESDVHCQFAVKLYQGEPECKITIDFEEVKNPQKGFDISEGAELIITLRSDYYIKDENKKPSSYAEFYLYVD